MKFNFKYTPLIVMTGYFFIAGCNNSGPTSSSFASAPANDPLALLVYQGSPVTAVINPNLYAEPGETFVPNNPATVKSFPQPVTVYHPASLPMSLVQGSGVVPCITAPCVALSPTSWFGTVVPTNMPENPYAYLVTGMFNDPENAAYPPGPGNFDSIGFQYYASSGTGPGGNSTYDLTPFQGIQFFINLNSVDNAIDRLFQVNTLQTVGNDLCGAPPGQGRPDLVHCYDAFQYDFTDIARDQWVFVQKRWAELKQFGNGSPPSPPTLTGVNLQQFQYFEWIESNAAASGPMTVNFQITGVRFF